MNALLLPVLLQTLAGAPSPRTDAFCALPSLVAAGPIELREAGDSAVQGPGTTVPWGLRAEGWRTDAAWYDGKAEKATYAATRTIYGVPRRYTAVAYTNKQRMDPATTTKAVDPTTGIEVFKHHWSERVPTEKYDYDFSTATFTATANLAAFKLTVSTQEDCGASFKSVWRSDRDALAWFESVYFPDAGMREGSLASEAALHFTEELTLLLRDYPFDAPPERATLVLVPGQKDTHARPFTPETHALTYVGREELDLPLGKVAAHHLRVQGIEEGGGGARHDLWFDARGAAPWLHVLVRYQGPNGVTYALQDHERTAYWER